MESRTIFFDNGKHILIFRGQKITKENCGVFNSPKKWIILQLYTVGLVFYNALFLSFHKSDIKSL